MSGLTHLGDHGRARMVDVGSKEATSRRAPACGELVCTPSTLKLVKAGKTPKGSVIQTAELAGVMAAKRTADLIPLCHTVALSKVEIRIDIDDTLPSFSVIADARTEARTGVEMEALTAVSVACLTLFDMLKAVDRSMTIGAIRVTAKEGGKSGSWEQR